MRSGGAIALLAVSAAGAGLIGLVAAGDEREIAFNPNTRVIAPAGRIAPGHEVCQTVDETGAAFDALELTLSTGVEPGPPLAIAVHDQSSYRVIARGRLRAGARDNRAVRARLGSEVPEGLPVAVCMRNAGARKVAFYTGYDWESAGTATADGRSLNADVKLVYLRSQPRSALSEVPKMFERAAVFRPEPVGAWTFWLLLAAVAAGVPLLLAAALRSAEGRAGAPEDPRDPA